MVENKTKSINKPKPKEKEKESKPKPKPKSKPKPNTNTKPKKEKKTIRKSGGGITLIQEVSENTIDENYERNLNTLIKKMKDQDLINNDGIRFGWNNSSPI